MNQFFAAFVIAGLLLTPAQTTLAGEAWNAETAIRQARHPAVADRVAQMLYLAPLLPAAAIQDQIDAVINDPELSEPAREKILYDYAYRLREMTPDAVALGGLHTLAAFPARVLVAHPESRGAKLVPLFDVASAARGTINQWLRESAQARATADLDHGNIAFLAALPKRAHYQQVAGTADAVRLAPLASVKLLVRPLERSLASSPQLTPIVLAAAYRLQDENLLRLAIRHGNDKSSTINKLFDYVPARQAAQLWFEIVNSDNAESAGLAIAALGRHANSVDGAHRLLITTLGDPERGAAAALALGPIADSNTLDDLAAILNQPPDPLSQTRAALTLKINGSTAALEILRVYAENAGSNGLANEVQQWLQ